MKKLFLSGLFFLAGCFQQPENLEDVIEKSEKSHEGVDINITPHKEGKNA